MPTEVQHSSIYGFATGDFNGDLVTDFLAVGNFHGTQISIGKLDASFGHFIEQDREGKFKSIKPVRSGFAIKGECRDVKVLKGRDQKKMDSC